MTGIGKITKQNDDGTVEIKEYSAPELFKALVQEQEVNDRNAQIACDTIAELSKDKERLTAELTDAREAFLSLEETHKTEIELHGRTKDDLTASRQECEKLENAAKHWNRLYRKVCQDRQDDAHRYGEQIESAEAQLTELSAKVAVMVEQIKPTVKDAILNVEDGTPLKFIWLDAEVEIDQILSSLPEQSQKLLAVVEAAKEETQHHVDDRSPMMICNCNLCNAIRALQGDKHE